MKKIILLTKQTKIKLNNNREMYYCYMSDFDNPIFRLDGDKNKLTIIDNRIYTVCGDDEPSFPVKEEFQSKIFENYDYDFFKNCFVLK